jgi:hypothetical protein
VESERFDAIIRTLSAGTSRRGVLAVLAGIAGLGGSAAAGKGRGHGKTSRQHGKAARGKHGKTKGNQEPQPQTRGSAACRAPGHPCEGNQECCHPDTTICVASGPGDAKRCLRCPEGQIACANACVPDCPEPDQCHLAGACDPSVGQCVNPPKSDGSACNDRDACTQTDTCQSGKCVGGNPVVCKAKDQCHVAGTCDSSSGACTNPNAPDGTTCTTTDNAAGACVAGDCQKICTELKQRCSSTSDCCAGLTCDQTVFSLDPNHKSCCRETGQSCPASDPEPDCSGGFCRTACCQLDFGTLGSQEVACVQGTCCQPAGDVCLQQGDCCTSGPAPLTCGEAKPSRHWGYCIREGGGVKMCLQDVGAPCQGRCECATGYCVAGRCSETCGKDGAACANDSACCESYICVNGRCG